MRGLISIIVPISALHAPLSVDALRSGPKNSDDDLFAVDEKLWPGCLISNEYPYEADLFGFGRCSLQSCSCQEVRWSSLVWGFAAHCDRSPGQIIDFVATMRLEREHDSTELHYPQKIDVVPTVKAERVFAEALQAEMKRPKWGNLRIPIFEQVGIKLGSMNISLKSLRGRAGNACMIYDESTFTAWKSGKPLKNLTTWALPESFFSSYAVTSLEVRGAFPLVEIWSRLGPDVMRQTLGTVLLSLGHAFLAYEEANWAHCDRNFDHILFRKSSINRDMPSALIIDQDRTWNLALLTAGEAVKARRQMLHWFALVAYNTCHRPLTNNSMFSRQPVSVCDVWGNSSEERARDDLQMLASMTGDWHAENDCKGALSLKKTMVVPAIRCAAGEADCVTLRIAYWIEKLQAWAARYYGGSFQEQSRLRAASQS